MKRRLLLILLLASASCQTGRRQNADTEWQHVPDSSIAMSEVSTMLPQAGAVELVEASCSPCHSLRYIEMQPALSYSAWESIVDKMIHAYGAPVRDSASRQDIINYLFAIRGRKEAIN